MIRAFLLTNDELLNKLAADFCREEVSAMVDLKFGKIIVVCEVDAAGIPSKVLGISQQVVRIDYPLWHFVTPEVGELLIERNRSYLEDSGFLRGTECFIHVARDDEHRCPEWKAVLERMGATKSNRWSVEL